MEYTKTREDEALEAYDEFLDEEGEIDVAGMTFYPSTILKECDPIAYRCGFADWLDANELEID